MSQRDAQIRTLITRFWKADFSRAKISDPSNLSGDAVVIFLPRTGPDDDHVSNIFERASALFSQEQLVELTFPKGLIPPWTPPALNQIRLEGEEAAAVPVFDSCEDVRVKIDSYLEQPDGPGSFQLCQILHEQLKGTARRSKYIGTTHLHRFMAQEGPFSGARGAVYYAAYVFFEKLRIAEGRPKSDRRLEMERLYPRGIKLVARQRKRILK